MEDNKNGVLITLKEIFKYILTDFIWSNDSEINKKKLIEEYTKICNFFINGGLIYDFKNVANSSNNNNNNYTSTINNGFISIMDTFIKFHKDGSTHLISSIIKTNIDFKIIEDIDMDSIKPEDFFISVKNYLEKIPSLSPHLGETTLNYLICKQDEVRQRKMFNITKQQFEPAAEWRDVERKLMEMIEKEKITGREEI